MLSSLLELHDELDEVFWLHQEALVELRFDLASRLLDAYDVYQHLMDYWVETMQDDCYLISADGWKAEAIRVIELDKKGKAKDKGWTCDLLPKPLLVARYFARERVEVAASWNGEDVAVTITDDGPGFAPEIMDRIGEPYVTNRRRARENVDGEASGLGLGFFIAKTLLERSGATLDFENRAFPERGAVVRVHWGRDDFERPMAFAL